MSEGFTCRGCGNLFFQAPKCVSCGAQKLYDSTVKGQWREIETQAARIAELEVAALQKRVRKLEYLVQCLLDEDPNDLAADGGVTVLDVWRKEARAALAGGKDEC